jgi:hypothetical protein
MVASMALFLDAITVTRFESHDFCSYSWYNASVVVERFFKTEKTMFVLKRTDLHAGVVTHVS